MSKLFNHHYFSAANGYGCEMTYAEAARRAENDYWRERELKEAKEDLETGITENVPEFVWMEETKSSTAKK